MGVRAFVFLGVLAAVVVGVVLLSRSKNRDVGPPAMVGATRRPVGHTPERV